MTLEKQKCLSDLHSMPTAVWLCVCPKPFHSRSQAVGAAPHESPWVLWQNQAVAPAEVAPVRLSDIHWPTPTSMLRAWRTPRGGAASPTLTWSPRQGTEAGQLLDSLQGEQTLLTRLDENGTKLNYWPVSLMNKYETA